MGNLSVVMGSKLKKDSAEAVEAIMRSDQAHVERAGLSWLAIAK